MIQKIKYRLVFNRKNHLNGMGEGLIQVEAYLGGRKVYFSTHTYVRPDQWNGGLIVNHPQANDLNAMLYSEILRIQAIEIDYFKRGIVPTLALIREAVRAKTEPNGSFIDFCRKMAADGSVKKGTADNRRSTANALRDYRATVTFNDVTLPFVKGFERFLAGRKAAPNTVIKHMHQLRAFVNEAIRMRYISADDYPFRDYRMQPMTRRNIYLTPEELRKVERYAERKNPRHRRVVEAFLFCCYTGLRFSDLKDIREEHFKRSDGRMWLDKTMVKTGIRISLPVSLLFDGKALALWERYGERIRMVGCNSSANRKLRYVMERIGIEKEVTWHVARHTFAVLLLHRGTPISTVQKLLGHTSIKTTQVYADVMGDTIVRDLLSTVRKRRK